PIPTRVGVLSRVLPGRLWPSLLCRCVAWRSGPFGSTGLVAAVASSCSGWEMVSSVV
ncbi:unnamed protein product, partial [Brassica rapa subsp. narinosa]